MRHGYATNNNLYINYYQGVTKKIFRHQCPLVAPHPDSDLSILPIESLVHHLTTRGTDPLHMNFYKNQDKHNILFYTYTHRQSQD
jgi:murein tripeptide amidase MpaA